MGNPIWKFIEFDSPIVCLRATMDSVLLAMLFDFSTSRHNHSHGKTRL